jgi:UDPglucose 6-dehydrogenase
VNVAVVGTGYVGLVSGACLAELGHEVVCIDTDSARVDQVNRAEAPLHEEGLAALLERNVGSRLRATTSLPDAVRAADVTLIAVGTPTTHGQIDLSALRRAVEEIGDSLAGHDRYHVVAVKSTVVPGTTDFVVGPILEERVGAPPGKAFGLGANPEFLTEGQAVADFMEPDRIVFGAGDARALETLDALYAPFPSVPRIRTNTRTAEMIKYASNALLATMISFANEFAALSSAVGNVDVTEVMAGVHASQYLTSEAAGRRTVAPIASFLEAGCGFGGSCLPKDVRAIVEHGRDLGVPMEVLSSVLAVNERQLGELVRKLERHFESLDGVPVTVLGLAFKPDTDDTRESPAIPVVEGLLKRGARVTIHDPAAGVAADRLFPEREVFVAATLEEAVDGAAAILLVTRWDDFRRLPELLAGRSPQPLVIDGRRVLDKRSLECYDGIGL